MALNESGDGFAQQGRGFVVGGHGGIVPEGGFSSLTGGRVQQCAGMGGGLSRTNCPYCWGVAIETQENETACESWN